MGRKSRNSKRRRKLNNRLEKAVDQAKVYDQELVEVVHEIVTYNYQLCNPVPETKFRKVENVKKSVRVKKQRIMVDCQKITVTTVKKVPKHWMNIKLSRANTRKIAA